jgi:hypothetical protein
MCPFHTAAAADFIEDRKRFLGGCAGHFGKTRGDAFWKIDAGGDSGCMRRPPSRRASSINPRIFEWRDADMDLMRLQLNREPTFVALADY